MAETEPQIRLLRFENFEVDLRSGELRKSGVKLRFGGQPFQVLTILLERPGDVVTREELQKRLWPDTFVDVDHNLNTAINKIREVLGDSAESPRFVETLPRRGYRFIGELERPVRPVVEPAVEPVAIVEPDRGRRSRKLRWMFAAGALAICAVALVALIGYRWRRQQRPQEQEALTAVPFTALAGQAISPAFSPDGSRIAFAWNGDPKGGTKGYDLYVKAIGSETLLRLTQHPSDWITPTWSPDGTQIAFHRVAGADTGIYVVPALGGPERKLRSTRMPWRVFVLIPFPSISWSPDGKWIAFADVLPEGEHPRLFLLSMETLETSQIPINPKCMGEDLPAFSHRGEYLAYWCSLNGLDKATLSFLPFPDGKPRTTASFQGYPNGLTWSADDTRLIYSFWDSSSKLGHVNVANGSAKGLAVSGDAAQPSVSAKGDKLAFSATNLSSNIWRRDLLHPEAPAVELVPSSRRQIDAQYSPDGKRIAFASFRSGVQGVWISNEDGSNLVQISNPTQPSGSPQWSPDGNKIAFDSRPKDRWEIYIAGATEGIPKKLIINVSNVIRPHWSRDGKWIYFRSAEAGRMGLYRCPASGGDAIALSKDTDGFGPQESFDGKTIFFVNHESKSTLKQALSPGQPATESEVEGLPRMNSYSSWTVSPGGIYFVPAEAPRSIRYFDFATRQIRPIFEADRDLDSGLSVSSDDRWLLYSQVGDVNSDIMLVDHFH